MFVDVSASNDRRRSTTHLTPVVLSLKTFDKWQANSERIQFKVRGLLFYAGPNLVTQARLGWRTDLVPSGIDARRMAIAVLVGLDRGRNVEQDKSIDAKKRMSES